MTTEEATKILSDTIKILSVKPDHSTLSTEEKKQRLATALRKNRFPFRDKRIMTELIPVTESQKEILLLNAMMRNKRRFAVAAELNLLAGELLKEAARR